MKKTNFILNGFLALATVLVFAQCSDNNNAATSTSAHTTNTAGSSNMKIAYVEIDSLLTKYNFWNDLNEVMIQKEENIRTTLNEKAKKLDADAKEFQRKYENNGYASPERAQQEYQRIQKQQQDLQALQQKLSEELASENQKNGLQLRDSINSFLKIYNQDKGYDLIISNTGFDNLLYANPAYNITQEIIDGLNARYSPSSVKK
ncbi:OmpH family outer membrane protein [Phocaeicola sp.]|uniref:OmpH family outer membrane protein n=1 Tax=Phocaeicola sp. TaxID=2773926 RepID=UPI0023D20126|nr:OmpH family outer membrane protein [Phocaeicola sp.]MDE5677098.1 OmpH family outer membrane protein [Phocaeicola sp.]